MQQFNLEEWLKDKSRKVVTRDGRLVRIVCWDAKMECPIMALALNKSNNKEIALHYRVDGTYSALMESDVDLFFADEEEKEELSEFERELEMMMVSFSNENLGSDVRKEMSKHKLHSYAHRLLDLARKEICLTCKEYSRGYQEGLKLGREDVLKDLPKWKKFLEEYKELDAHAILLEDNERVAITEYLEKGDYYIELDDLKTLPKEE